MARDEAVTFRMAEESDLPRIAEMLHVLAAYEHLEDRLTITEETLRDWIFRRHVLRAILEEKDGALIGMATYYETYSTFRGRTGLYLEDLIVRPGLRGHGYGKALLRRFLQCAREQGCYQASWNCLSWNVPARQFYESLGAERECEWLTYHIGAEKIESTLQKKKAQDEAAEKIIE